MTEDLQQALSAREKAVNDIVDLSSRCGRLTEWGIDALLLPLPQMEVNPVGAGMTIGSSALRWAADATSQNFADVAIDVLAERDRQEFLFPLPDGFPPELRHAILVEEVGEVAKAWLENQRALPCSGLYEELVQVTAVCARWIEVARDEVLT